MLLSCSLSSRQIIRTRPSNTLQPSQHEPSPPHQRYLPPLCIRCYIIHSPIHLLLSTSSSTNKLTHSLVRPPPPSKHTHTHTYQSTAFQVNPQPSTNLPTMAASNFSATGAPVLSFTESRGYRPKMGCVLQGRDQLYMSSRTLQGRDQLYMSSCTLQGRQGRDTLYMSSCSLMRN
jgi:hypothetical protein